MTVRNLTCLDCETGSLYLMDSFYFLSNCSFLRNSVSYGGALYIYNTTMQSEIQ